MERLGGDFIDTHSSKNSSLVSLSFAKCRSLGEQRQGGILICMRGLMASFSTKLNCSGLVICPSLEIDLATFGDNCENSSTTTFCPASSRALWLALWTSLVNMSCPVGRVFCDCLCSIVSSVISRVFYKEFALFIWDSVKYSIDACILKVLVVKFHHLLM